VDAVYVATPPGSHMEYAIACAKAGKPCYVEKPMGRTHSECLRMEAAFREAKVPLFVAYYRRALPRFLSLKALIDSGAIGRILHVHVVHEAPPDPEDSDPTRRPWRLIPELSGGGRFLDLASHTLDILDFLLGPIAQVEGFAANIAGLYPPEDYVGGAFRFLSGAAGSGHWCFCAEASREYVEIVGDGGTLRFSVFSDGEALIDRRGSKEPLMVKDPSPIQLPLIRTVVEALLGRGSCPSTAETAARANRVMDSFLKGFRTERAGDKAAVYSL
jgi:1,5-anhydro-D-fructose reductase (1,5-anhydro-D-mannitol-forming)